MHKCIRPEHNDWANRAPPTAPGTPECRAEEGAAVAAVHKPTRRSTKSSCGDPRQAGHPKGKSACRGGCGNNCRCGLSLLPAFDPQLKMRALVAQLLRGWSPERSDPRLMGLGIRSGSSVVAAGVGLGYAPCIPCPLRGMHHASSLRSSPRAIFTRLDLPSETIHDTTLRTENNNRRKTIVVGLHVCYEIHREPTPFTKWLVGTARGIFRTCKRCKQQAKLVKPNHGVLSPRKLCPETSFPDTIVRCLGPGHETLKDKST